MPIFLGWRIQVFHPDVDVGPEVPIGRPTGHLAGPLLQQTLAAGSERNHQTGELPKVNSEVDICTIIHKPREGPRNLSFIFNVTTIRDLNSIAVRS